MKEVRLGSTALRILAAIMSAPKGHPMCVRELTTKVNLKSPNSVTQQLYKLRKAGLVHWSYSRARTLVATCRFIPASEVPNG